MKRFSSCLLVAVALLVAFAPAANAAPSCTKYASGAGSDDFPGDQAFPYKTVGKLVSSITAGQTGCLIGAAPFVENVTLGTAGITLSSADPLNRSTIAGRVSISAEGVTLKAVTVDLRAVAGIGVPVTGDSVTLLGNEIFNDMDPNTCVLAGQFANDRVTGLVFEGNRIHDCPSSGIALEYTDGARIVDNAFYDNYKRAIELYPDADGSVIEHNVVDNTSSGTGLGAGVHFGGASPTESSTDDRVELNVFTDSEDHHLTVAYDGGSVASGNSFVTNCYDGGVAKIQGASPSVTVADNVAVGDDPYFSPANRDFAIVAGSPCAGMGIFPSVATGDVTAVGRSSATVTGQVNSHFQIARVLVEFGLTAALGRTSVVKETGRSPLPEAVDIPIDGLEPGMSYSYRLVAQTPAGGRRIGETRTFATPALPDADGDGVPDERDVCKSTPAGAVDAGGDGCPDDGDLDGVPDERDRCPTVPRTAFDKNGDGCPDDSDGDGLVDARDACATEPAGLFDRDGDGCPNSPLRVTTEGPRESHRFGSRAGRLTTIRYDFVEITAEGQSKVVFRCSKGCRLSQTTSLKRTGKVAFRKLRGGQLPLRAVVEIFVTKAGKVGRYFKLTVNSKRRRVVVTRRCIPLGASRPGTRTC